VSSSIPLTRRQRDIVAFFETFQREHGMSPTLEEIAQHLGVNKVTVFGHVAELERKGVLARRAPRASRSLSIVPARERAKRQSAPLCILGSIAAGLPLDVFEVPEPLALEVWTRGGSDRYALRVRGTSMIDDGIRDGDLVIVERKPAPKDGDTVVAILEGEKATLKRFYRDGARVRLQPANSSLPPIWVDSGAVEVRGVVIGVVRDLR
jgi:repressor LexA